MLLLAAVGSAPWHGISAIAILWGILGLVGVIHVVVVAWHMRAQQAYSPQFEDRLFHVVLSSAAYAALISSGYAVRSKPSAALLAVAVAALLLFFIVIHNAWDAVTYHILVQRRKNGKQSSVA